MKRYILSSFILFACSQLIGQDLESYIDYLRSYEIQEIDHMNTFQVNNPDATRQELKNEVTLFFENNYNAPAFNDFSDPQNPTFNQVSDELEYIALKSFFEETNGENWSQGQWDYPNWKDPSTITYEDFQDWYGVTVIDGDVVSLSVPNNNLSGEITDDIGALTKLKALFIPYNSISGYLTDDITDCQEFLLANISYNEFNGIERGVLLELYKLEKLLYLSMHGNSLGQAVFDISNLEELKSLNLSNCSIEELYLIGLDGKKVNFEYLYLQNNALTSDLTTFGGGPISQQPAALATMQIQGNHLDFIFLETMFDESGSIHENFLYSPQEVTLASVQAVTFQAGGTFSLSVERNGFYSQYEWQKQDGNNWISVYNGRDFEKEEHVLSTDAGVYRCKVSNTRVTELTLFSQEIVVSVEGVITPITNDASICNGESTSLVAEGQGTIKWYSESEGGVLLHTGATFTTPALHNSTTYYVAQEIEGEESERVPVEVEAGPVFDMVESQELCRGESVQLYIDGEDLTIDWGDEFGSLTSFSVSPKETTTYSYSIEDNAGCSTTGEVTITVSEPPVASAGQPSSVCEGETVTLAVEEVDGASYLWEPGGATTPTIDVVVNDFEDYTVTVTSANGCSDQVTVSTNLKTFAVATEDRIICVTETVTLSAMGGDSYEWSTGETTQEITFDPSAPGEYTFTVTATKDGCTSTDDVIVTVEEYCPGTPESFMARAISTSEIRLNWKEPAGNHEHYVIQKRNAELVYETVATLPVGTTSWLDENLEAETVYFYRIYSEVASVQSEMRYAQARTFTPNQNFIAETEVLTEGTTDPELTLSLNYENRNTTWKYLNGLGSDMQTVVEAGSPSQKDVVQPIIYDEFGMRKKHYLAYTVSEPVKPGNFRDKAEEEVLNFYTNPPEAVAQSNYPYAYTLFDDSPQSKVLAKASPGEDWSIESGNVVNITKETNTADEVPLWEVSGNEIVANSYYPEGQLSKTITINEDGERVTLYKDMLDRELMREVEMDDSNITTFFIYNNRGSLLYRITPKVANGLSGALPYTIDNNTLVNECYSFEYDEQERLTRPK